MPYLVTNYLLIYIRWISKFSFYSELQLIIIYLKAQINNGRTLLSWLLSPFDMTFLFFEFLYFHFLRFSLLSFATRCSRISLNFSYPIPEISLWYLLFLSFLVQQDILGSCHRAVFLEFFSQKGSFYIPTRNV